MSQPASKIEHLFEFGVYFLVFLLILLCVGSPDLLDALILRLTGTHPTCFAK